MQSDISVLTRLQEQSQQASAEQQLQQTMAASLQLPEFTSGTDAKRFLRQFENFCTVSKITNEHKTIYFEAALKGSAKDWLYSLSDETSSVWAQVHQAFLDQYDMSSSQRVEKLEEFFTSRQQPGENASDYIVRMMNLSGSEVSEETAVHTIVKGLNSDLRTFILAKEPKTVKDLNQHVKKVQGTAGNSETQKVSVLQQQVESMQQQMEENFARLTAKLEVATIATTKPLRSRSPYPSEGPEGHRQRSLSNQGNRSLPENQRNRKQGQSVSWQRSCRYCREYHSFDHKCPKFQDKQCYRCGDFGHIQSQCRVSFRSSNRE